jgi:hypothetical protein
MKSVSCILSLIIGSGATIFASTAPAHALITTYNLQYTPILGSGITVTSATATFDSALLSTSQTIDIANSLSGLDAFSLNLSNGTSFNLSNLAGWLLVTNGSGTNVTALNFFTSSLGINPVAGEINGTNLLQLSYWNGSGFNPTETFSLSTTLTPAASSAVPFDIPGGSTIPVAGSLLGLAVLRKARKSTSNIFSITTTEKVH